MEITDALVAAIVKELLRRLACGELSFSDANEKKAPSEKPCSCGANAGSPCCKTPVAGSSPGGNHKRIISESEIRRLCPASNGMGQAVEIGVKDLITPLAVDYISKMRITVNRIG